MTELNITPCDDRELDWIDSHMEIFNRKELSFTGVSLEITKNYAIKDGEKIVAGIKSCFYLGHALSIGDLFVDEKYRHKGLGSRLLNYVENEVRSLGAKLAHLYTLDFQAKDFYLKHGYEIFAVLDNCPMPGHKCFYMKKDI